MGHFAKKHGSQVRWSISKKAYEQMKPMLYTTELATTTDDICWFIDMDQ
jgi:hypothetical protein